MDGPATVRQGRRWVKWAPPLWAGPVTLTVSLAAVRIRRVQIHGEDRVELTVVHDNTDYRRIASELRGRQGWQRLWLLPLVFGSFVSLAAQQFVGTLSTAATMFSLSAIGVVVRRRQLTNLPDWAFGPITYRLSGEGVEVESPAGRRLVRWLAISGWRKSPAAYWFTIPGGFGITLPRRMLTTT